MFEFIKTYIQRRQLKKFLNVPRKKKIHNIADTKNIGIIFAVGDQKHWNTIYHFAKQQESRGARVWMLGYQATGTIINYIFTHQQTIILHEKEDCNGSGIPKSDKADAFLKQHYDLLIDTTEEPNFYGKYAALRSDADLKVTFVNTNNTPDLEIEKIFDMLIQGNKPLNLPSYLSDIEKYLGMVQK